MNKRERDRLWKEYREEWNEKGEPIFTTRRNFYHPVDCPACIIGVTHLHDESEPLNRQEYVDAVRARVLTVH